MKTFYILNKGNKIIGELKTEQQLNEIYFVHAIAHAYSVPLKNIILKEQYEKDYKIYYCVCCGDHPVDVLGGYDTCPDCSALTK